MDLIKSSARRSKASDIAYILLNLAFVVAVHVITVSFTPPYLAYLLVALSKWRVFAVRPRYWFANLQTNTVDVCVGFSVVTLLWLASGNIVVQLLVSAIFAAWLLIIKPRSKPVFVKLQAGISQFLGMVALFSVAYQFDPFVSVLIGWLIGYAVARHILSLYHDVNTTQLSLIWGLVLAELSWLGAHWTSAYQLTGALMIPQIAIIASLLGFVAVRAYGEYDSTGAVTVKGLRSPLIFCGLMMALLLVGELSAIDQR